MGYVQSFILARKARKGTDMEEKKHCKWYNDEFCTNGDSPFVADYCPVVEYPELCKCRELDKDINVRSKDYEEKKLATMICSVCGKEIDKNYARNTIGNYCKTCAFDRALILQIDKDYASGAMDENIIFDVEKALENNQDAGCYVGDLLRIIQRLQSEKAEYERKLANGDLVPVKELVDKGELVSIDWHNEQVLHDTNVIEEQKEEIERLTEENDLKRAQVGLLTEQVEFLKDYCDTTYKEAVNREEDAYSLGFDKGKEFAVKDTAKEIFKTIKSVLWEEEKDEKIRILDVHGVVRDIVNSKYGVEVE